MPDVSAAASIVSAATQPAAPAAPELGADGKPAPVAAPEAKQFAALAAAEKQRRAREGEIKAQSAKLEQERQAFAAEKAEIARVKAELDEYRSWKSKAKANPAEVMKALGLSYDDITAQKLNGEKPTPEMLVRPLEEKVSNLEQKLAAEKEAAAKQIADQRKAEITALEAQFEEECSTFVGGSEKHPLTKHYDGAKLVSEIIREHWQHEVKASATEGRKPKMLSIQEAADLAEKHFRDQYEGAAKLLAPKPDTQAAPAAQRPNSIRSISNDLGVSSVSGGSASKRLTPSQRAEAMLKRFSAGQ